MNVAAAPSVSYAPSDAAGETFFYDREHSPSARIIVRGSDGSRVTKADGAEYDAALRTGIARMIRKARRFMRTSEGQGTHWTQGYGGRVIEWALSLKEEKGRPIQVASADAEADRDHPVSATVAAKYKISVQFSGGAASYVAAKLILEQHGHDDVALIFADTLIEDEDLYRFLDDAERHLQHPIIRISEGRDPWTVFFDERMMGNSRVDPCSKILKRKLLDKWRVENCASDCTLVIGYDASEDFRFQPLKSRMLPVKVRAPLLEQGVWKEQVYAMVEADGLRLPRLYGMGFSHNNCGGFCVKAGQASFALLLENLPERYAQHEAKEEEFRKFIGKDVSIMRDRRGGVSKPLTMREFRERHEREPILLIDRSDVGGCLCMEEPDPLAEDDDDGVIAGSASATGGGLNWPSESQAKATKGKAETAGVNDPVRRSTAGTGLRVGEAVAVQPATSEIMDVTAGETAPNSDPIVAELIAAHRARKTYPAGHTFSMTNPVINGQCVTLGTCTCGETFSYAYGSAGHERMDAAIEAHWQKFDCSPDKVDGRGQPINAELSNSADKAVKSVRRKGKRAKEPSANSITPVSEPGNGLKVEYAGEVTAEQVRQIDDLARAEFRTGNWVDVESEPAAGGHHPAAIASALPLDEGTAGADASINDLDTMLRRAALEAIAAGREVTGQVVRDLIGEGLVHATATKLIVTDEGHAFLKSEAAPIGAGSEEMDRDEVDATALAACASTLPSGKRPEDEPVNPEAGAVSHVGAGESLATEPARAGSDEYLAGIMARDEKVGGVVGDLQRLNAERTVCDDPSAYDGLEAREPPRTGGSLATDDDWLLKAAAELAWREPPQLTEVQAALLDFGKVYAPARKVERPILRWHGGKWKLAPWIISHFPPHKVYIEPFGGAGSVMLQKLPATTEVWNDLEGEVVNLFRVLRSRPDDLARLIYLTPFSREEYHSLYEEVDDPVERARQFVARSFMGQSSKGALRKSGFDSRINPDGFASRLNSLRAMPEEFFAIVERFRNIVIEQRPADAIFAQYDRQDVLFYVDPPYLSERAKHYTHELDEAGHTALLETLRSLAGMVVLSGYRSELYDAALTDWRRVEIEAHADGGIDRTEVLWLNPACAAALDEKHPTLFNIAAADAANAPPPHGLSGD